MGRFDLLLAPRVVNHHNNTRCLALTHSHIWLSAPAITGDSDRIERDQVYVLAARHPVKLELDPSVVLSRPLGSKPLVIVPSLCQGDGILLAQRVLQGGLGVRRIHLDKSLLLIRVSGSDVVLN